MPLQPVEGFFTTGVCTREALLVAVRLASWSASWVYWMMASANTSWSHYLMLSPLLIISAYLAMSEQPLSRLQLPIC